MIFYIILDIVPKATCKHLINNLKRFKSIITTSPNTSGWVKIADYPSGFDKTNTLLIGFSLNENDMYFSLRDSDFIEFAFNSDGLMCHVLETNYYNKRLAVTIYKYD